MAKQAAKKTTEMPMHRMPNGMMMPGKKHMMPPKNMPKGMPKGMPAKGGKKK